MILDSVCLTELFMEHLEELYDFFFFYYASYGWLIPVDDGPFQQLIFDRRKLFTGRVVILPLPIYSYSRYALKCEFKAQVHVSVYIFAIITDKVTY